MMIAQCLPKLEEFFTENLYGYRENTSTSHSFCKIMDSLRDLKNKQSDKKMAIIALDQKGTFDNIRQSSILEGFQHTGAEKSAIDFIESYLGGRTKYVAVSGSKSENWNCHKGCGQGRPNARYMFYAGLYIKK